MQPIRKAERLVRAFEDTSSAVRGLPLPNQDKVWNRVRSVGPDELLQFDRTLVGETGALAGDLAVVFALDEIDIAARDLLRARVGGERGPLVSRPPVPRPRRRSRAAAASRRAMLPSPSSRGPSSTPKSTLTSRAGATAATAVKLRAMRTSP
jgi:hypothetical protein